MRTFEFEGGNPVWLGNACQKEKVELTLSTRLKDFEGGELNKGLDRRKKEVLRKKGKTVQKDDCQRRVLKKWMKTRRETTPNRQKT